MLMGLWTGFIHAVLVWTTDTLWNNKMRGICIPNFPYQDSYAQIWLATICAWHALYICMHGAYAALNRMHCAGFKSHPVCCSLVHSVGTLHPPLSCSHVSPTNTHTQIHTSGAGFSWALGYSVFVKERYMISNHEQNVGVKRHIFMFR